MQARGKVNGLLVWPPIPLAEHGKGVCSFPRNWKSLEVSYLLQNFFVLSIDVKVVDGIAILYQRAIVEILCSKNVMTEATKELIEFWKVTLSLKRQNSRTMVVNI